MAKSLLKKKQRIAHNKACNEEHEIYPGGDDFVSSIIEEMSNNDLIAAMYSNKFEVTLPELNKSNKEKIQNHINQNPSQSHLIMSKSKKFGLSRKFPLMEKSQRALKQIKHNMKIPKPRAHLAGLSDSSSFDPNSVSLEKSKKTKEVIKGVKATSKFRNKKISDMEHGRLASHKSQINKKVTEVSQNTKAPKKIQPSIMKNSLAGESVQLTKEFSTKAKSAQTRKKYSIDNSSDDDDNDYEKFIKKEKKNLPKKSKVQTNNKKSQKSLKKVKKKDIPRAVLNSVSEGESDITDIKASASTKSSFKRSKSMKISQQSNNSKKDELESKKIRRKRTANAVSKSVSSESDSEVSDYGTFKSYRRKSKRTKKSHQVANTTDSVTERSDIEMNFNEAPCHNSSTESEDLPPPSEVIPGLPSNTITKDNHHSEQLCNKEKLIPLNNLPSYETSTSKSTSVVINNELNVSHNEPCVYNKTPNRISLLSSNHPEILPNEVSDNSLPLNKPNILPKTNIHLLSDTPINSMIKMPDVSLVVSSDKDTSGCALAKNISLNDTSKKENSTSLIVDLTESDNECENSFAVLPKIMTSSPKQKDSSSDESDESDIELLDVIVPDLPDSVTNSNKNVPKCINSSTNELNIKTEKVNLVHSVSITKTQNIPESNAELQTSFTRKNEVAYTTGICQKNSEKDESKDKIMKQFVLNNDSLQSNLDDSKDLLALNKKVKEEPCDDCEIILDSASTRSLSSVNNSKMKTEEELKATKQISSVYVSSDSPTASETNKLSYKEERLQKVPVSNFKNSSISHEKNLVQLEQGMHNLHSVDVKTLLEDLKREFATYQDILQTEQSVEATFKILEKCQAEKLMFLKTKITASLASASSINECNSIKNAMNELLDISNLGSSKSVKDGTKVSPVCPNVKTTSDFSVQDLKTFTSMNIVPLSCISESDIKPNLSELQRALKQEPDSMSFAEKCIVCGKDASAACQQCAKVFFCSNECGMKYWEDGHKDACMK